MLKPSSISKFYNFSLSPITAARLQSSPLQINRTNSTSTHHHNHEEDVLIEEHGNVKKVILNRPKALNALNLPMIRKLSPLYKKWNENPNTIVVMRGHGDKAFCAGGDIRAIYDAKVTGKGSPTTAQDFFGEEYVLNHMIAKKNVTQVALLNGITMGGGVGLSVHGKYRVATDNTMFAMPETAIGFFCDVGGSYFLPRLRGAWGMYLALTGARLTGVDVTLAGVATHFVKQEHLHELEAKLLQAKSPAEVDAILEGYKLNTTTTSEVMSLNSAIEKTFSQPTVEDIIAKLNEMTKSSDTKEANWAKSTLATLEKMSPTSLKVVHRQILEGKKLDYAGVFKMEYRMAQTFMNNKDFFEGVRALLVDKDKNPKWTPKTISEVSANDVDQYFQPTKQELQL